MTALNNASPACTDVLLISVQDIHICFLLNYKTAFSFQNMKTHMMPLLQKM